MVSEVAAAFLLDRAEAAEELAEVAELAALVSEVAAAAAEAAAAVADAGAFWMSVMCVAASSMAAMFSATVMIADVPGGVLGSTPSVIEPRSVDRATLRPRSLATTEMSARLEATAAMAGYS